jgi:branched-chain amino acid transport system ATP-binding protein
LVDDLRPLLTARSLVTGYGKKQVVNGVSLDIAAGEIVALIGHNGAGKSTLLKALFGLLPIWKGQVEFGRNDLQVPKPRELLRAGISYVPQGNRVFTDLTVLENLEMAGVTLLNKGQLKDGIERVLALFPALKTMMRQRAATLSGGQKQMLALSNALILSPRLLLLDEPSLGLARPLVTQVLARVQQINRGSGVAVLMVEQKVREALKIAHRVYVLRGGSVSFSGTPQELRDEAVLRGVYM